MKRFNSLYMCIYILQVTKCNHTSLLIFTSSLALEVPAVLYHSTGSFKILFSHRMSARPPPYNPCFQQQVPDYGSFSHSGYAPVAAGGYQQPPYQCPPARHQQSDVVVIQPSSVSDWHKSYRVRCQAVLLMPLHNHIYVGEVNSWLASMHHERLLFTYCA